ncbi:MAG: hypothetical protein ABW173_01435 [Sphingomonas sp.]
MAQRVIEQRGISAAAVIGRLADRRAVSFPHPIPPNADSTGQIAALDASAIVANAKSWLKTIRLLAGSTNGAFSHGASSCVWIGDGFRRAGPNR